MKTFAFAVILVFVISVSFRDQSYQPGASTVGVNTGTTTRITYANADKIVLVSNSYGAGYYGLPNKLYFGRLSAMSDYNWENFSFSGHNINQLVTDISSNAKPFNASYGIQDYNGKYALICEFTNSLSNIINTDHNLDNYILGYKKVIRECRSLGMIPIISSEWRVNKDSATNSYSRQTLSALKNLATQENCYFIDITPTGEIFDNNQTNRRWTSGHPGTMTEAIFSNEVSKALNEILPRPTQTLKIFVKRNTQNAVKDSLYYRTIEERDSKFFEIKVSQVAMQTADTLFYDDIVSWSSQSKSAVAYSDYLKLLSTSQNLTIANDYSLVESVIPGNAGNTASVNISMPLSSGSVQIWVKNNMTGTYDSLTTGTSATITAKKYIDVDKVSFLIYNSGGYTITTSPTVTWTGFPIKDEKNYTEIIKPATGAQLLTKTGFEIADTSTWHITNRVPIDGQNPLGFTRVGFVSGSTTATQDFTVANTATGVDVQIEIWCRTYIPLFAWNSSNPPVTTDSYDYGQIEVNINDKANSNISIKRRVPMHWSRILINTHINAKQTAPLNLKIKSTDKEVEFARVTLTTN